MPRPLLSLPPIGSVLLLRRCAVRVDAVGARWAVLAFCYADGRGRGYRPIRVRIADLAAVAAEHAAIAEHEAEDDRRSG